MARRLLSAVLLLWSSHVAYTGTIRLGGQGYQHLRNGVNEETILEGNGLDRRANGEVRRDIERNFEVPEDWIEFAGRLGVANLTQGDMKLTPSQTQMFYGKGKKEDRTGMIYEFDRWHGGVIPYKISSDFDAQERNVIKEAMKVYEDTTCLKFVEKKQNDFMNFYYIKIIKANGCYSYIGRVWGGQELSLGKGCVAHGIILHELMHAAGFLHEQSRYDRDNFIIVNYTNIDAKFRRNFDKHSNQLFRDINSYDLGSIMHYGPKFFAKDKRYPTIIVKDEEQADKIGNSKNFTEIDIAKINELYNCPETKTTTESGNWGTFSTFFPTWPSPWL